MTTQELFIKRCIDLAKLAAGRVAPNPMVGALLTYENRIIGEGYHQYYGGPHAEVNCIGSVKETDLHLIRDAVLYVSLEPCVHFGKTPPCADLIIENKIKKVIIGCRDPFAEVNGKGIEKLQDAGIEVTTGILEAECRDLNKRFFTFYTQHRPYIILKWAQTHNGKIAEADRWLSVGHDENPVARRLHVSNEYSNRVVHKWRSEEASILVGTNTALKDNPELTNRFWPGPSPLRLVVDMDLKLPSSLKMFTDDGSYTIVFNLKRHDLNDFLLQNKSTGIGFYQVTHDVSLVHQIVHALYQLKIISVLIEGGAKLIQSFIDEELWDEARVITNTELQVANGLSAPLLSNHQLVADDEMMSDQMHYFVRHSQSTEHIL